MAKPLWTVSVLQWHSVGGPTAGLVPPRAPHPCNSWCGGSFQAWSRWCWSVWKRTTWSQITCECLPHAHPRHQGGGRRCAGHTHSPPPPPPHCLNLLSHTTLLPREGPRPLRKVLTQHWEKGWGSWSGSAWGPMAGEAIPAHHREHVCNPGQLWAVLFLPQADGPAGAARTSTVPWVSGRGTGVREQGWEDMGGDR